jgi:hypothetical protein
MNTDIPFGPRLSLLWRQSHREAGTAEIDIPQHRGKPSICLYPASFVDRINKIGYHKSRDFNFRGAVYIDEKTEQARQWLLKFAQENFTSRSYFQVTDKKATQNKPNSSSSANHQLLGDFDFTFSQSGFVPKESPVATRGYFDEDFFRIMCESEFTLCPAGDAPWSMRFYEAILCKSIPILKTPAHAGRNIAEYNIGYKYYLATDIEKPYRKDWADGNYNKFIKYQTLIS